MSQKAPSRDRQGERLRKLAAAHQARQLAYRQPQPEGQIPILAVA